MELGALTENLDLRDLCEELEAAGCVLEFVSFDLNGADGTNLAVHRTAALGTLARLKSQIDDYFFRLLQSPEYIGRQRSEFFQVHIWDENLGDGERIGVETFLGPGHALSPAAFLKLLGHDKPKDLGVSVGAAGDLDCNGFLDTFLDPPYRLRVEAATGHTLLSETLKQILGGLRSDSVIYRWSCDSSNYFDAGKEWWGTLFCTVHCAALGRVVGVVASSTD